MLEGGFGDTSHQDRFPSFNFRYTNISDNLVSIHDFNDEELAYRYYTIILEIIILLCAKVHSKVMQDRYRNVISKI